MNSFGRIFRVSIFGESHGKSLGAIIGGCPPGLRLSEKDFAPDLSRRRSGAKGTTARKEADMPTIASGVFKGHTSGSPITILFDNRDIISKDYESIKNTPRPGHADFTSYIKYGNCRDYRGGGHSSGRITVGLVAAGVIAKKLIGNIGINASLLEVGGMPDIDKAVEKAIKEKSSIGGIIECSATNIPAGLGEPFFDSFESALSHLIFSIPAIKGIEFGAGFKAVKMTGFEHNDEIISLDGKTASNHAGGINGGITNGNDILFRVAVKPTSSISQKQKTIDLETGEAKDIEIKGRHDVCIALRMPVIIEAALAITLADFMLIGRKIPAIMGES